MMDEMAPRPAYVTSLCWDVVAWNAAADRLFGFTERQLATPNLLRLVFADPDLRRSLPSRRSDAPRLLEGFRRDLALVPDDPVMLSFVEDLKRLSPDFRRWWQGPRVHARSRGLASIVTEAGPVTFQHEVMTVDEHRHLYMTVYFADPTAAVASTKAERRSPA